VEFKIFPDKILQQWQMGSILLMFCFVDHANTPCIQLSVGLADMMGPRRQRSAWKSQTRKIVSPEAVNINFFPLTGKINDGNAHASNIISLTNNTMVQEQYHQLKNDEPKDDSHNEWIA
jgi:hypothetical protein